jgi:hypothetical protein
MKHKDITAIDHLLSTKRPHDSESENIFGLDLAKFLLTQRGVFDIHKEPKTGEILAYSLRVQEERPSQTLFSCHIDTIHPFSSGQGEGIQEIRYARGIYSKPIDSTEPLGADDGAGIWLMLNMILAGIPGLYLFHRGEERGGIGSRGMAHHYAPLLGRYKRAVAFDRRGIDSVITHQAGGRCCSLEFALALANGLNTNISEEYSFFSPDDSGVYTDTAEYTDIIPECTNISCGYAHEHTAHESLDFNFLQALLGAVLKLDWESLPTARDPRDPCLDDDPWDVFYGRATDRRPQPSNKAPSIEVEDLLAYTLADLRDLVYTSTPAEIVKILDEVIDYTNMVLDPEGLVGHNYIENEIEDPYVSPRETPYTYADLEDHIWTQK